METKETLYYSPFLATDYQKVPLKTQPVNPSWQKFDASVAIAHPECFFYYDPTPIAEPLTLDGLKAKLTELAGGTRSSEMTHVAADEALLSYINDEEVTQLFESIEKGYA